MSTAGAKAMAAIVASIATMSIAAVPAVAAAPRAMNIYVSPQGDDDAAGTLRHPFATVGRAQRAVRAAVDGGMRGDVVVALRGGRYPLRSPLVLTARADSGRDGHRVVYRAYGYGTERQERPVLSGAVAIGPWTAVGKGLWRADVGDLSTRQLFRDGRRVERGSIEALPGPDLRLTRTGYLTPSKAPLSWPAPAEVDLTYDNIYTQGICGVKGVSPAGKGSRIVVDEPCFRWLNRVYTYEEEEPDDRIELAKPSASNSVSFLDRPLSWAFDGSRPHHHFVYLRAGRGEDPNSRRFTVPRLTTLVRGSGKPGAPIHDIAFEGLGFEGSGWLGPDEDAGFLQTFGPYYYDGGSPSGSLEERTSRFRIVPGAVSFAFARDLDFLGDRFHDLGADALTVTGSARVRVARSSFAELAGGGVGLYGRGPVSTANRIEDNLVREVGQDYQGSIGFYLENLFGSYVGHNTIANVPYSAIVSGAGAGNLTIPQALRAKPSFGLRITGNEIDNAVTSIVDGGGIYVAGRQGTNYRNGARISGNVIHGVSNPAIEEFDPKGEIGTPNAIYTDIGADYATISDNVLFDNHQSWGGVFPGVLRFQRNFWDDDELVFYGKTDGLKRSRNRLLAAGHPRAACRAISRCRTILARAGVRRGG